MAVGDRGQRGAARSVELDPQAEAAVGECGSATPGGARAAARANVSRRARAPSRWRSRTASAPASSSTAISCSSTGLEMSSAARAAASRWTSAGLARTQPIRSPAQNVLLIEPIVITVSPSGSSAETGSGRIGTVEVQAGDGLVDHQRRPRRAGERDELLALGGGHREPGRVLVVGDHVRERGRGLAQRRRQHLQVPAVREHRHRHRPGADRPDRVERRRIARVLDQHAVAGAGRARAGAA